MTKKLNELKETADIKRYIYEEANKKAVEAYKTLNKFYCDLEEAGKAKYIIETTDMYGCIHGDDWEFTEAVSKEDMATVAELKAVADKLQKDANAKWDEWSKADGQYNKTKRDEAEIRRGAKWGVAPENAKKFTALKRKISSAKRNISLYENKIADEEEILNKAIREIMSIAPEWISETDEELNCVGKFG